MRFFRKSPEQSPPSEPIPPEVRRAARLAMNGADEWADEYGTDFIEGKSSHSGKKIKRIIPARWSRSRPPRRWDEREKTKLFLKSELLLLKMIRVEENY